ncbi:MAG: hypothetical protein HRT69_09870 [Flavobacteriaceae bacterium]|nr:hypothetical protein [Flavobacteriaceae bacterium]
MDNKFTTIKKRCNYISETYEVSKSVFYKKIEMSSGSFRGKAINTPLNSNAIEKIIANYPQINVHWLITGEGNILTQPGLNKDDKQIIYSSSFTNNTSFVEEETNEKTYTSAEKKNRIKELEQENKHLKEMIALKDDMIGILKNATGKANSK